MFSTSVAVVGAGFIGPVHVEALKRVGVKITGILGVDDAEWNRAAETLGLPRAYHSLDELLKDEAVQAVHITTPNRLHYDMASRALKAGKHVLCEKPLAMNSKESAELVALAKQAKRTAAVNYNLRFYPLCLEAKEKVRGGGIGNVLSVVGSYVQDWLLLPTDYNWRVLASEGGELRAIADIGTHWLDLMHAITGLEVEALCADLKTVHPLRQRPKGEVQTFKGKEEKVVATEAVKIDTEDCGAVLLKFRGGAHGVLWVSQITAGRKNCLRFEISGAKSALYFDSEEPNTMWIGHRGGANESLIRDPSLLSDAARRHASYPGGHAEGFPDTFKQCFKAFYGYIDADDFSAPATFPTFADGHREILLCEAILNSHRQQKWVTIEETAMKLGFVSAILPDLALKEVAGFAATEGFDCVELMCWPVGKAERRYAGVTHVDVTAFGEAKARGALETMRAAGVAISGLGYYPNPLTPDARESEVYVEHLRKVIAAAARLGVNQMNTFIGRDWTKTVDANWPRFLEVFRPLVKLAEEHGVRIGIENCPMYFTGNEWPSGKNLAYCPAVWRRMFDAIPSANFGLNYDPSHLVWQRMDYLKPLHEFAGRIFHVHAKDVRLDQERLDQVGIMATPLEYHRPKLPGLGEIDWGRFMAELAGTGYDGPVCIEVEDRDFEGSIELRKQALRQSGALLRRFIPRKEPR